MTTRTKLLIQNQHTLAQAKANKSMPLQCSSLTTLNIVCFIAISCLSLVPHLVQSQCKRNPIIFNFGDSNSDTGGYAAAHGVIFGLPNGREFFHEPTGRLSDGRLMIDFLCESLNTSYLTPYMNSLAPNLSNGVNFAIGGAATYPKRQLFSLDVQVMQFLRFRKLSPMLVSKGYGNLVREEDFWHALYTIDIGQNDFAGKSYAQIIENIPSFITEIKSAILDIYTSGGRNFWIHGTGPLGCMPEKLATLAKNASDLDRYGCLQYLNDAAKKFNKQLQSICQELRSQMEDATIVYVDIFSIKYELITNFDHYGFANPLMTCCGCGGPPYNYKPNTYCGQSGCNLCSQGLRYVSWDGVHYTEAANAVFVSKIFSTNYTVPQVRFDFFCND